MCRIRGRTHTQGHVHMHGQKVLEVLGFLKQHPTALAHHVPDEPSDCAQSPPVGVVVLIYIKGHQEMSGIVVERH